MTSLPGYVFLQEIEGAVHKGEAGRFISCGRNASKLTALPSVYDVAGKRELPYFIASVSCLFVCLLFVFRAAKPKGSRGGEIRKFGETSAFTWKELLPRITWTYRWSILGFRKRFFGISRMQKGILCRVRKRWRKPTHSTQNEKWKILFWEGLQSSVGRPRKMSTVMVFTRAPQRASPGGENCRGDHRRELGNIHFSG